MITRAQLIFLLALCVAGSVQKFVEADKVQEGHRDTHHEKDFLPLLRLKRYALGRVPLAYLQNRVNPNNFNYDDDTDMGRYAGPLEKRYRSNSLRTNPAASHFRELQERQSKRVPSDEMQPYRNLEQYYGPGSTDETSIIDPEVLLALSEMPRQQLASAVGPLSDEELQALVLLLDGYRLQGTNKSPGNYYGPPAQYFAGEAGDVGKRETGRKRSGNANRQLGLEQPMSFENSVGSSDNYPVFLNQKRSKRIGDPSLKNHKMMTSSVRIKKETAPEVAANLDKVFANLKGDGELATKQQALIPTTAISSSADQIPAPASSLQKKAIDWSHYFGIDKRQQAEISGGNKGPKGEGSDTMHHITTENNNLGKEEEAGEAEHVHNSEAGAAAVTSKQYNHGATSTTSTEGSMAPVAMALASSSSTDHEHQQSEEHNNKSDKLKEKKDKQKQENDTDKPDRKWILQEFYKNLAMSTNVKRKREASSTTSTLNDIDKLEKIERKMEQAGDQIIWDALKYTGAHKDAQMSPEELAHVKKEIIQKLSTAYSLEKVREAIEEFRQELAPLKDKHQQYY